MQCVSAAKNWSGERGAFPISSCTTTGGETSTVEFRSIYLCAASLETLCHRLDAMSGNHEKGDAVLQEPATGAGVLLAALRKR